MHLLGLPQGREAHGPSPTGGKLLLLKIIVIIIIVVIAVIEFPKSKNLKEHKVAFINNRIGKNE